MQLVLCETATPDTATIDSYSPFCLKIHRALRAAGLRYERNMHANPGAFRKLNPAGKVPVLVADGRAIPDSTAILLEIARWTGALVPADGELRARAWLWEDYADRAVNGFLVAARWANDANWPRVCEAYFAAMPRLVRRMITPKIRKRVLTTLATRDFTLHGATQLQADFHAMLDHLEALAPTTGYWVSPEITVADVSLFGQLQSFRTGLTPHERSDVEARPRLRAYLDRVDVATAAA